MTRLFLGFAGLNGALWLILSAYMVHGMADLSTKDISSLAIASGFALIHSLFLMQLGLHIGSNGREGRLKLLRAAGLLLIFGILLFCFIILFKVLWPASIIAVLSPLTPFGGLALICAWLLIALQGFYRK